MTSDTRSGPVPPQRDPGLAGRVPGALCDEGLGRRQEMGDGTSELGYLSTVLCFFLRRAPDPLPMQMFNCCLKIQGCTALTSVWLRVGIPDNVASCGMLPLRRHEGGSRVSTSPACFFKPQCQACSGEEGQGLSSYSSLHSCTKREGDLQPPLPAWHLRCLQVRAKQNPALDNGAQSTGGAHKLRPSVKP